MPVADQPGLQRRSRAGRSGTTPTRQTNLVAVNEQIRLVDVSLDQLVQERLLPGVELVRVVVREPLPYTQARVSPAEKGFARYPAARSSGERL